MGNTADSENGSQRLTTKHGKKRSSFSFLKKTCEYCSNATSKYINLKNCAHLICDSCITQYIESNMRNIDKYPFICCVADCNKELDVTNVCYALDNNESKLSICSHFLTISKLNASEREQCPKCEMVFKYNPKWHDTKQKRFTYIPDEQRKQCIQCNKQFQGIMMKRHRCRICGEVLCDDCINHKVPLSASSSQIIEYWLTNTKQLSAEDSPKNLFKRLSRRMSKGLASSTLMNLFTDADIKQNTLDIERSASERQLIEGAKVQCCMKCYLDYYEVKCNQCSYVYCVGCRKEWSDRHKCDDVIEEKLNVDEVDEQVETVNDTTKAINNVNIAISKASERGEQLEKMEETSNKMMSAAQKYEQYIKQLANKH